jgi:hypothetical protein
MTMAVGDTISAVSPTPTCVAPFSRSSTAHDGSSDKTRVPFDSGLELCKDLVYSQELEKSPALGSNSSTQTLPDAPRVQLGCTSAIVAHCLKDLDTPGLNKLGEKLWWAGPTPDIVSLCQNAVLDRRIQITEDSSVHLLWVEGIIYVKPLPAYLASFAFWEFLMDNSRSGIDPDEHAKLLATCLGFLRTYASLIQHRSDFNLARRHDLLSSFEGVTFEAFIAFIAFFDAIPDHAVSSRWRYGLLQLDTLNLHSAIHLRRWHLNRFQSRYSAYFSRFFPVILFIFALSSVMLSAMQVIVAAKQISDTENEGLKKVLDVFVWFGTEAISWSLACGSLLCTWWIGIRTNEAWHARQTRKRIQKKLRGGDA